MISLIVAYDRNGVMGNGPDIPWHLPADFAYFKETTMGAPIIMGRKTFESIGRPLPGRTNIVLTRDTEYSAERVEIVDSMEKGIELAGQEDSDEIFIIGGSQIYKQALQSNAVDRIYVTHVDTEAEGDIIFPTEHLEKFVTVSSEQIIADEKNSFDIRFAVYEKNAVVDGKQIAKEVEEQILRRVSALGEQPHLGIYVVGNNGPTQSYVQKKQAFAGRVGIRFSVFEFDESVEQSELESHITKQSDQLDGIVIQLPLPSHIDTDVICSLVPENKDPDMLNKKTIATYVDGDMYLMPPVVGAIGEMVSKYRVGLDSKKVLIIGKGKLVGIPAAVYFTKHGCEVIMVDKADGDFSEHAKQADIIVSGAGVSDIVTPDMVTEGVVLFDAGTSGSSGALRGDIDWACADKARLFSRSPGGIGPLTVARLFKNFVTLVEDK